MSCLSLRVARHAPLRNLLARKFPSPTDCLRMSSSCDKKEPSTCGKVSFICGKPEMMGKKPEPSKVKAQFKSMWLNPFCDEEEPHCPYNPRFDDIYYVESDKAARRYWQTWVSCPPLQIKPKKICCNVKSEQPPLRRRKHGKPKTACAQPEPCPDRSFIDCPRFKRKCHKAGRIPPSCFRSRGPSHCAKPLTPYPSFSECRRLKPEAPPLSECICWRKPMLCEAWVEFRKRAEQKKLK
ncbi:uncharacterized protein Dwil_GK19110 [Drosophila willistoni]|uniref:Uncharacterized protein n=1 Tax=Drosophila willistoni TaxID=7260 RepID=B4NF28_DROWI|nr:uncharacterized protein LOC6649433 [Drosophila willistoni]EDW83403.1 uncharacterized protein Dwil_GK19110 [Drosophila willistoni]